MSKPRKPIKISIDLELEKYRSMVESEVEKCLEELANMGMVSGWSIE